MSTSMPTSVAAGAPRRRTRWGINHAPALPAEVVALGPDLQHTRRRGNDPFRPYHDGHPAGHLIIPTHGKPGCLIVHNPETDAQVLLVGNSTTDASRLP